MDCAGVTWLFGWVLIAVGVFTGMLIAAIFGKS